MNSNLSVLCPFSLERTAVAGVPPRCECCNEALPPLYLNGGQSMLPLPIQFLGLSKHGKTSYFAALTMVLQRVNAIWNGFTVTPATESSRKAMREVNLYFETGKLPSRTLPGSKDPYVMLLNRIPKWIDRALMIRDCSGEAFREIDIDLKEANFLLKSPLTLIFVSLADINAGYAMDDLMTSYLNALAAHGVSLGNEFKKVVVVLTKADLLLDSLPQELLLYISEDPIWQASRQEEGEPKWFAAKAMDAYLADLEEISRRIEEWICRRAAGRTLVTLARDRKIEIEFTLISSTGAAPQTQDNTLPTGWEPSRVLDPLLWALVLDERRKQELSRCAER